MEGDPSEKVHETGSTKVSSHGDYTDDSALESKHKDERDIATPPEDKAALKKLDSKVVKVNVEEEDPFKHLPPEEAAILRRQVDIPVVKSGFTTLYRYSTRTDIIIIIISTFCAIAGGAALPLMTVRISNSNVLPVLTDNSRSSLVN